MTTRHLVLDIEAIRDPDIPYTDKPRMRGDFYTLIPRMPDDLPSAFLELHDPNPFPPPPCWKILCIGAYLFENHTPTLLKIVGDTSDDEATQLQKLATFLEAKKPTLVTWNGRHYDVPVLFWRMAKHGIDCPYMAELLIAKRYQTYPHFDLKDWTSGFGAAPSCSLDQAATVLGAGKKPEGVDGSKVETMPLEQVRTYCLNDVVMTARVFLEIERMRGTLNADQCEQAKKAMKAVMG